MFHVERFGTDGSCRAVGPPQASGRTTCLDACRQIEGSLSYREVRRLVRQSQLQARDTSWCSPLRLAASWAVLTGAAHLRLHRPALSPWSLSPTTGLVVRTSSHGGERCGACWPLTRLTRVLVHEFRLGDALDCNRVSLRDAETGTERPPCR